MARYVHRQGDSRVCGATTVAQQSTVRANNRFVTVACASIHSEKMEELLFVLL